MTEIIRLREVRKGQFVVDFYCDYCGNKSSDRKSHFKRKVRHYCNSQCYAKDRKQNWEPSEQPTWIGGVSSTESHRRWKAKNPKRMAHLKARRYAREKNAKGSHTYEQWLRLCEFHGNKCASCKKDNPLTKDHVIPLSKGGTDYIENIQPLCRSCNSKKGSRIYENLELLEENQ